MRHNLTYLVAVAAMLSVATGWSFLQETATGVGATQSAKAFLATLSAEQKSIAVLPLDSPQRVDWHVIPKAQRKGLQLKDMTDGQRQAALALLRSVLSPAGYEKATKVMALEATIRELEKSRQGGAIRDPERYYFTLFGEPSEVSRWGLSIEGHHLSLNFLVDSGVVIASTPMFFAANPHVVREGMPGNVPPGIRTLADEELLAFQLIESLDAQQRKMAILDAKAPRDVRGAGEAQPPAYEPEGLSSTGMNETQQGLLKKLIAVYVGNLPTDLASARLRAIDEADYDKVYFAWAGADRPGIGHYYRIQGPTFLIEFVNIQSDSAGNAASHIHSYLRDPRGDFAIPAKRS